MLPVLLAAKAVEKESKEMRWYVLRYITMYCIVVHVLYLSTSTTVVLVLRVVPMYM